MTSVSGSLALVSAVYGRHDDVKTAPPGFDECIFVTDERVTALHAWRRGWKVIRHPYPALGSRMAAKVPKCRPDWFTNCENSVWVDGSVTVNDDGMARIARAMLKDSELIFAQHPESVDGPTWKARTCLHDEAVFCASRPKTSGLRVVEQAESYLAQGIPRKWGLWAATVIGRRHTPRVRELGSAWLLEMERWTVRDQIALPFLLWQRDWRPATWPFHLWKNPYLSFTGHNRRT